MRLRRARTLSPKGRGTGVICARLARKGVDMGPRAMAERRSTRRRKSRKGSRRYGWRRRATSCSLAGWRLRYDASRGLTRPRTNLRFASIGGGRYGPPLTLLRSDAALRGAKLTTTCDVACRLCPQGLEILRAGCPERRDGNAGAYDKGNRQGAAPAVRAGWGRGPYGLRPLLLLRQRVGLVADGVRPGDRRGVRAGEGIRHGVGLLLGGGDGGAQPLPRVRGRGVRRALLARPGEPRRGEAGMLSFEFEHRGERRRLAVYRDAYAAGGNLALVMLDAIDPREDGYLEEYGVLTVNLPGDPVAARWCACPGHVVLDTNNNPARLVGALEEQGGPAGRACLRALGLLLLSPRVSLGRGDGRARGRGGHRALAALRGGAAARKLTPPPRPARAPAGAHCGRGHRTRGAL